MIKKILKYSELPAMVKVGMIALCTSTIFLNISRL